MITINRTLLAITNRCSGFAWTHFNCPVPDFRPVLLPVAARQVQSLLWLDRPGDDYPVYVALGALAATPFIAAEFADVFRTYELEAFRPKNFTVVGAALHQSGLHGPPAVLRQPQEWPVNQDIQLTYHDTTSARVQWGRGRSEYVAASLLPDNRLQVAWPADTGVRGTLYFSAEDPAWEAQTVARIRYAPLMPAAGVVQRDALLRPECMLLLESQDCAELYSQMATEWERLACLLLALGKSNTAIFPA